MSLTFSQSCVLFLILCPYTFPHWVPLRNYSNESVVCSLDFLACVHFLLVYPPDIHYPASLSLSLLCAIERIHIVHPNGFSHSMPETVIIVCLFPQFEPLKNALIMILLNFLHSVFEKFLICIVETFLKEQEPTPSSLNAANHQQISTQKCKYILLKKYCLSYYSKLRPNQYHTFIQPTPRCQFSIRHTFTTISCMNNS